jgi:mRNA degradation ribonuclease J1/J2
LNDRKRDLKFVILENGEIYALNDEALEEQNKNLFNNEIVDIENLIQKYFSVFQERKNSIDKLKEKLMELQKPKRFFNTIFSKQNKAIDTQNIEKNIQKTETEMWNMLGINFWENILYFSF